MFDVHVNNMGMIRRSDEPTHGDLLIARRNANNTFVPHMIVRNDNGNYYILNLDDFKIGYFTASAKDAVEAFVAHQEKVIKSNYDEIFLVRKHSYDVKLGFKETYGYRKLDYDRHYVGAIADDIVKKHTAREKREVK